MGQPVPFTLMNPVFSCQDLNPCAVIRSRMTPQYYEEHSSCMSAETLRSSQCSLSWWDALAWTGNRKRNQTSTRNVTCQRKCQHSSAP
ncbi:hypothetical protein FOPG_19937 [Fusarium oxysporum f. sp. conglutinans race 2 54008]|uniref:Uncharacterized protein n=1 Tax=Fusarium oxysporum f. sp. conglutinans race 2 54008 TaxID=1089457 RepID=X0GV80_FUSOX|nr:hypothetical protein FOPG_19937 [Fusarium oxysporum f. sp. conglutinans race 2 54008]